MRYVPFSSQQKQAPAASPHMTAGSDDFAERVQARVEQMIAQLVTEADQLRARPSAS